MKLYRIRRKDNQKFFGGLAYPWHVNGHEKWNDNGTFFRDIDTISNWLKVLCCDWKKYKGGPYYYQGKWKANRIIKELEKFDKKLLKRYEVVITNVNINGHKIIEAKDLVK